jgi:hypothetical protein
MLKTMPAPLHEHVADLAFLLGTWTGEGEGHYPTVAPFRYREELRFWHVGKPFLAFAQRTWAIEDEDSDSASSEARLPRPLHGETGYWRVPEPGRVELVVAHPMGIVEVEEGTVDGATVTLSATALASTTTAKSVERLERDFRVAGDVLTYRLRMAAVGQPLLDHLEATLRRQAGSSGPES